MAISQNFPDEGPTLNLNFAGGKVLDPRITFIRSSVGTYMDANGLIVTAAADEPRFDHRYVNGEIESLGLLVEEQRTNLFIRGSTLGDVGTQPTGLYLATPTGQSAVVSSDFDVDGNDKSIKHTRGSSGDNNVGYYAVAGLTTGVTHSFSTYVYIPSSQQSSITSIRFGPDNNYSNLEYGYADTNIVDRWQRVVGKYDPSTQTSSVICRATASGGTYFYTDAWQLEVGGFPTSYIPTSGSTVTRVHDRAYYENVDQTDWFSKTEGTVVFEHTDVPYNSSDDPHYPAVGFAETTGGGSNPSIQYYFVTNNASGGYLARYNHPTDSAFIYVSNATSARKVGFVYKEDDYALVRNGSLVGTDSSGAVPSAYMLVLGMNAISNTGNNWNAHLKNLQYYPTRLSNTVLQNLTK